MKTCKGNYLIILSNQLEAMVGLKARKDRQIIADNVKRQKCVPLSEFEALRLQNEGLSRALTRYKNKAKQTIENLTKSWLSGIKSCKKDLRNKNYELIPKEILLQQIEVLRIKCETLEDLKKEIGGLDYEK